MKQALIGPIVMLLAIVGIALFVRMTTVAGGHDRDAMLKEAYESYVAGEKASTVEERQRLFNRSLEIYSALEDRYHPAMGNGKLYYNMGNNFYQLEAYPWAVLDLYRAKALRPRDEKVQASLNNTLKKLNQPSEPEGDVIRKTFFSPFVLSIPEKIQWFCALVAAGFAAFSLYVWTRKPVWKGFGIFFACLVAILMANLSYAYYLAPIEGVVIRSSLLYRDAGKQYAPVSEDPVPSGQKIEILAATNDGQWLKIQTSDEVVGFIPGENLRLIAP